MFDEIDIPKKLRGSFKRIFRKIPHKLQKKNDIIKTAAAYLKIGGEKLAKQSIEVFKIVDKLETDQRKKRLRDEALLRAVEARKIKETSEIEEQIQPDTNIHYI